MLNFIRKLFGGADIPKPALSETEIEVYEAARLKHKEEKKARKQLRVERRRAKKKNQEARLSRLIERHLDALYFKKKSLRFRDDYGKFMAEEWKKELEYFIDNILPASARFLSKQELIPRINQIVIRYRPKLTTEFREDNPIAFERHIQKLLCTHGWDAQMTKGSGDQGVDVIAKKGRISIAIQCKLYSSAVGTSAVQEVIAGMSFYRCDFGWVVTNATFTPGAKALASKADILLMHYSKISEHLKPSKRRKRANEALQPPPVSVTPPVAQEPRRP